MSTLLLLLWISHIAHIKCSEEIISAEIGTDGQVKVPELSQTDEEITAPAPEPIEFREGISYCICNSDCSLNIYVMYDIYP